MLRRPTDADWIESIPAAVGYPVPVRMLEMLRELQPLLRDCHRRLQRDVLADNVRLMRDVPAGMHER